jgi:uncharacterized protein (DUF302 family)
MYYLVNTEKSFDQAVTDLQETVANNKFGVLHIHDIAGTLRSKGIEFDKQCKVFEVCNPGHAANVLATDMRLNMALPCRVSVYTEEGKTKIGFIKPVPMLEALSDDAALLEIAQDVEQTMIKIVDEAK